MSEQLEHYLEATLSEGRLDSNGQFTVSLPQLLEKLGSQSLYHWANYSLFAIRGLVRMGCDTIHISQSKREFWIVGHKHESCPELTELDQLLPEQILSGATGMALLARATACLVKQAVDQVMMARWINANESGVMDFSGNSNIPKLSPTVRKEGYSLGLYAHFTASQKFCDLEEHLAYAVQYCPIPVLIHKVGWWTSVKDLRICHWLDQKPKSSAHPPTGLAKVEIPLCCDVYHSDGQQLLLKPCGGLSHAHYAACCDNQPFEWLQTAWATDSISALGRFFKSELRPNDAHKAEQKLTWTATKSFANTIWTEKGARSATITTLAGSSIMLLSQKTEVDQIIPVLDGIALDAIKDQLQVPGVTLIACPPAEVVVDLGGQNLVQNQAFQDWLRVLRSQILSDMQHALDEPLVPPIVNGQPAFWKTCLATGATCVVGAVLMDGPQMTDLIGLTHGGIFGGTLVSAGLRVGRGLLPQSWQEAEKQTFLGRIQQCHDDAEKTLRSAR